MNSDSEPPSPNHPNTSDFFLQGSGVSALLIHGLSGTPYETRFLGERLASCGVRVRGVKLAGHAGTPEELGGTDHNSWYQSVVQGFEELRGFGDPVVVVGQSAGALLASRLAIDQNDAIAGLVMLAPAFFLPRWTRHALAALRPFSHWVNQLYIRGGESDIHDNAARGCHPRTALMPLGAALSLYELSGIVRSRLGELEAPTLVIHSRNDHTCPYEPNVSFISEYAINTNVRVVTLEKSYHVISVDTEKERVAEEVGGFTIAFRLATPIAQAR